MNTPKRRRGVTPKVEPVKKAGRGRIQDRQYLTPREEQYAQLIAAGLPMERAVEEIKVTVKEAARWHAEHPMLEKRICEIRGERYDGLTEDTINQHFTLLTNINQQIEAKLQTGADLSVKELKDAYEFAQMLGPMLAQYEYRQEQGEKKKIKDGDVVVIDVKDLTIMELMEEVESPKYREQFRDQNEKTFIRWFQDISQTRQKRILQQIAH